MAIDDDYEGGGAVVNVYTDFFKRDMQIYALGDIRFNKPKSLKTVGYTLALMLVWSLPMFLIIGPERVFSGPIWVGIVIVPPFVLGGFMSRPLFHNKPFTKDVEATIKYMGQKPIYTDLEGYQYDSDLRMDAEIWIADWDCYGEEPSKKGLFKRKNR